MIQVWASGLVPNEDGVLDTWLELPEDLVSGSWIVRLRRSDPTATVASRTLQIVPGVSITLDRGGANRGEWVTATIGEHLPGTLRLDVATYPVLGPIPTNGQPGEYRFRMPSNPAIALPPSPEVTVRNFTGSVESGRGVTNIRAITPIAPSVEAIQWVQQPTQYRGEFRPGESIVLTGRIRYSGGSPRGIVVTPMLTLPGVGTLPIGSGLSTVQEDGSFSVTAVVPSLKAGLPYTGFTGPTRGEIGLAFTEPRRQRRLDPGDLTPTDLAATIPEGLLASLRLGDFLIVPDTDGDPRLTVRLVDPDGNQPIEGATVVLDTRAELKPLQDIGGFINRISIQDAAMQLAVPIDLDFGSIRTQVSTTANEAHPGVGGGVFGSDGLVPFTTECGPTLARGITDAEGRFEARFDREWLLSQAASVNGAPIYVPVRIFMDGIRVGYALMDGSRPQQSIYDIAWHVQSERFYGMNPETGQYDRPLGPNPSLTFDIPRMPPLAVPLVPFDVRAPGAQRRVDGNGVERFHIGPTFPDLFSQAHWYDEIEDLKIRVELDELRFGALQSLRIEVGGETVNSRFFPLAGPNCSSTLGDVKGYNISLPDTYRLPRGETFVTVRITTASGLQGSRVVRINSDPWPSWLLDFGVKYVDHRIRWTPKKITLTAREVSGLNTALSANIPVNNIGQIDNQTEIAPALVRHVIFPGINWENFERRFDSDNVALSRQTDRAQTTSSLMPSTRVSFGSTTPQIVVDTGRIPLFRAVWGFWPLVSATVGADAWFRAFYAMWGEVTVSEELSVRTTLTTRPGTTTQVSAFINLSALLGLLSATGEAQGGLTLTMPIEVRDDVRADVTECLRFVIDMAVTASVGPCPFCLSTGPHTSNIAELYRPDTQLCRLPPIPRSTVSFIDVAAIPAMHMEAQVVPWQFEQGMSIRNDKGIIKARRTSGGVPTGTEWALNPPLQGQGEGKHPTLAPLGNGRWLAAWAQSGVPKAVMDGPDREWGVFRRAQNFGIRYSYFNGVDWSTPDWLPNARPDQTRGTLMVAQGRPQLSGCPSDVPGCPVNGRAVVVWINEFGFPFPVSAPGADSRKPSALYYAQFFGGNLQWTVGVPVDTANPANPAAPNPLVMPSTHRARATWAVVDGEVAPIIGWVENATAMDDPAQSRIRYRIIKPQLTAQTPPLPLNVSWFDMNWGYGKLHMAYTVGQPGAFTGTQLTVHQALGTCTGNSCNLDGGEIRDGNNRTLYAESVSVAPRADGSSQLSMRGLGFGPLPQGRSLRSSDAIGTVQASGDLLLAAVRPTSRIAQITAISNDGALHWSPSQASEAGGSIMLASGTLIGLNSEANLELQTRGYGRTSAAGRAQEIDEGFSLFSLPDLPDFVITSAEVLQDRLPEDTSQITVRATVANRGAAFVADPSPLQLGAVWDDSALYGLAAGVTTIQALDSGEQVEVEFSFNPPVNGHPDQARRLVLHVNPLGARRERDGSNNTYELVIGALPRPTGLLALGHGHRASLSLFWEPVDDSRVAGYRVYRKDPSQEEFEPVGANFESGWTDLFARRDVAYQYYVTAYTASGQESAPSEVLAITMQRADGLFSDRFQLGPEFLQSMPREVMAGRR